MILGLFKLKEQQYFNDYIQLKVLSGFATLKNYILRAPVESTDEIPDDFVPDMFRGSIEEFKINVNGEPLDRTLGLTTQQEKAYYSMQDLFPEVDKNMICRFLVARDFKVQKAAKLLT